MHVSVYVLVLQNCEWLITTVIVCLAFVHCTWIPMVILELIHASEPDSGRVVLIRYRTDPGFPGAS